MFKNKNISPHTLSFFNAFVLTLCILIIGLFLYAEWYDLVITIATVFLVSYVMFSFTLKIFVYRKLKLIYKFIYEIKATKTEKEEQKQVIAEKSIEEVSKDVEQWATKKKEEILNLQENENFRKEFLSNLSHELKTPVFAIQSYVETLIDGAVEDKDVNMRFLQKTAKNTNRLINLIEDISLISEIESNEMTLAYQQFIIQDMVKDIFDALSIKAEKKGTEFHIKKGCEESIKVSADRDKIYQVLINLLDNAIKYGKQNGRIILSFYNIDEKKALIEVSDDGYGIEKEHLSRVFERFYRTDKARSRKEGGTGLGLAIVKHIIEAHNQTINIRSKPNLGTTFGFTLDLWKG